MIPRIYAYLLARWQLYSIYSFFALLVIAPLLLPGFVLTLDMAFVPHPPLVDSTRSSYPFHALLHWVSYIIPADILQKIILLGILVGSGIGAHKLVHYVYANQSDAWRWAYLAAGTLYMINPFTYSRFMAGQYSVLLGYAILPFFTLSLLRFVTAPGVRNAVIVAVWAAVVSIVSIHTTGLLLVLTFVIVAAALTRYRLDKAHCRRILVWAAGSGVLWAVLNSYWLLPLVWGAGTTVSVLGQFDQTDRQAFATLGTNVFEILLNIVRLQGFWAEARGLYVLPQHVVPVWGLLWLVLLGVIGAGFVYMWRQRRFVFVVTAMSGLIAVMLASGFFGEILTQAIPFFAGYREPHKFAGLVALTYAMALPAGLVVLTHRLGKNVQLGMIAAGVGVPLVITFSMLWGFMGQLIPTQYPISWYQASQTLNNEPQGKVLFLPWHAYMTFSFNGRIIENPAPNFFDNRHVVSSNDPEYRGVQPTYPDPIVDSVAILLRQNNHPMFIAELRKLGFSHIMLAKEFDFADYAYIATLPGVEHITDSDHLTLYRIIPKQENQ